MLHIDDVVISKREMVYKMVLWWYVGYTLHGYTHFTVFILLCWLCGTVVERQSLIGELSLSHA